MLQNIHCFFRTVDILLLRRFIAATQQKNDDSVFDRIVNAIAGSKEKTQFEQILTNVFAIAKTSPLDTVDTVENPGAVWLIFN